MPTAVRYVLLGSAWSTAVALAVLSTVWGEDVRDALMPWILVALSTAIIATMDCIVWRHRCELLEDLEERWTERMRRIH